MAVTIPTTQLYNNDATTVRAVQNALKSRGYSLAVDGKFGPETARTISAWQSANGFPVTGVCDYGVLNGLGVSPPGYAGTVLRTQAAYNSDAVLAESQKAQHAQTPYDPTQADLLDLQKAKEKSDQERAALEQQLRMAKSSLEAAQAKAATAKTVTEAQTAQKQVEVAQKQVEVAEAAVPTTPGLFGLSWIQVGLAGGGLAIAATGLVLLLRSRGRR